MQHEQKVPAVKPGLSARFPETIPAGSEMTIAIVAAAPDADLMRGLTVRLMKDQELLAEATFAQEADDGVASAEIALIAPSEPGRHTLEVVVPAQSASGIPVEAVSLSIDVDVVPNATRVAIWNIPSPVLPDEPFTLRVGAKSAANESLAGAPFEILDEVGNHLAGGVLGDAPLEGTTGLYWSDATVKAPGTPGIARMAVQVDPVACELSHAAGVKTFTAAVGERPTCSLRVRVTDSATHAPIAEAGLRAGVYRATTDDNGVALMELPKGAFKVTLWKAGFEYGETPIGIDGDQELAIAATAVPEEDPLEQWDPF